MSTSGRGNLLMALSSIKATKWRSLLTVLGVIIGVASVVTVTGIGEGLKRQVVGQIDHFGKDMLLIQPGNHQKQDLSHLTASDVLFGQHEVGALTPQDEEIVTSLKQISQSAPLGIVSGAAKADDTLVRDPLVIATSSQLPAVIDQPVRYGNFFSADANIYDAVIGSTMAHTLFNETAPLGRLFTLRGQAFMVRGVFAPFNSSPLSPTANFDNAVFISYQAANQLTNNGLQFYAILAKTGSQQNRAATQQMLTAQLTKTHGGEQDFTVMDRDQAENTSNQTVTLLSTFISAIAVIALLVGGIGIMNVMLVSVTERMHEIGVRKAVGATNSQILGQFTLEAVVLSTIGGLFGILIAISAQLLLRTYTTLQPVITLRPILLASVISIVVGVVFGIAPAAKAARKDPISALRHE